LIPENHLQNDSDTEFPFDGISATTYTGFAYTVGYARAMMQAALAIQAANQIGRSFNDGNGSTSEPASCPTQ
jgi:phosphoglucomutase